MKNNAYSKKEYESVERRSWWYKSKKEKDVSRYNNPFFLYFLHLIMYKPRGPIALDEKSYDLSLDCLINKKTITLSRKSTPNERRAYRLLKEKRYTHLRISSNQYIFK